MKSSFYSPHLSYLKAVLLIVQLALCFGGPTVTQAGKLDSSSAESAEGYLMVYSATDPSDDGGTLYYAHSSYSIYTAAGKLFKIVGNQISRSDEIPTLVTLPVGSYTIEVRSENRGYVRLPIMVTAGRRTVVDPDKERTDVGKRSTHTKHSPRLAG